MKVEPGISRKEHFLLFYDLGDFYCINQELAHCILHGCKVFSVPGVRSNFLGITIHQNRLIPVVTLAGKSSNPGQTVTNLLVMNIPSGEIGIKVDRVEKFIPKEEFFRTSADCNLEGCFEHWHHSLYADQFIHQLDLEPIVISGEPHE